MAGPIFGECDIISITNNKQMNCDVLNVFEWISNLI